GPVQIFSSQTQVGLQSNRYLPALLVYLTTETIWHTILGGNEPEADLSIARDVMMNVLWPEAPPKSAQANLRNALYQLRKQLPTLQLEPGQPDAQQPDLEQPKQSKRVQKKATAATKQGQWLVQSDRLSLSLNPVFPFTCDVAEFLWLIALGKRKHQQPGDGQHEQSKQRRDLGQQNFGKLGLPADIESWSSVALYEAAVMRYEGDFLADFYLPDSDIYEEWMQKRRNYLRNQMLETATYLAEYYLEQHDYPHALLVVRRQLEFDPFYETGHQQLVRALAYNGDRQAALNHYHEYCQLLATQLDALPSSTMQDLHEFVRSGQLDTAPTVHLSPPTAPLLASVSPTQTPSQTPSQPTAMPTLSPLQTHAIPIPLTPLVGRDDTLDEIRTSLSEPYPRLVTITGMGGKGKSLLAHHVGYQMQSQLRDGCVWVELAHVPTSTQAAEAEALIQQQICIALGLPPASSHETILVNFFQSKEVLIVLDNAEHLVVGVTLLQRLLTHAPGLRFLVTSRMRLPLSNQKWVWLQGLAFPRMDETPEHNPTASGTMAGVAFEHRFTENSMLEDTLLGAARNTSINTSVRIAELNATFAKHTPQTPVADFDQLRAEYASLALFEQEAQKHNPAFVVTPQDQAALIRICQQVQGLPLALKLIAHWTAFYDCNELADNLQAYIAEFGLDAADEQIVNQIDSQVDSQIDNPVHPQGGSAFAYEQSASNIDGTLAQSWQFLQPAEQYFLMKLALFEGNFHRDAVVAIIEHDIAPISPQTETDLQVHTTQRTQSTQWAMTNPTQVVQPAARHRAKGPSPLPPLSDDTARNKVPKVSPEQVKHRRLHLLQHLVNTSLVQPLEPSWYRVHPLIKDYVREQWVALTEESPHTSAHLTKHYRQAYTRFFMQLLIEIDRTQIMLTRQSNEPVGFYTRQERDILWAWQWAVEDQKWTLLADALHGLFYYFDATSNFKLGFALLSDLLEILEAKYPALLTRSLPPAHVLPPSFTNSANNVSASVSADVSSTICISAHERLWAQGLLQWSNYSGYAQRRWATQERLKRALAYLQPLGVSVWYDWARGLSYLGAYQYLLGDYEETERYFSDAVQVIQTSRVLLDEQTAGEKQRQTTASAQLNLTLAYILTYWLSFASYLPEKRFQQLIQQCVEVTQPYPVLYCRHLWSLCYTMSYDKKEPFEIEPLALEAVMWSDRLGNQEMIAESYIMLMCLSYQKGDYAKVRAYDQQSGQLSFIWCEYTIRLYYISVNCFAQINLCRLAGEQVSKEQVTEMLNMTTWLCNYIEDTEPSYLYYGHLLCAIGYAQAGERDHSRHRLTQALAVFMAEPQHDLINVAAFAILPMAYLFHLWNQSDMALSLLHCDRVDAYFYHLFRGDVQQVYDTAEDWLSVDEIADAKVRFAGVSPLVVIEGLNSGHKS
ncbi:MAG: BTAD domain-containing putative transcriptional regulator, partial [Chloroflexota bacterium]